MEFKDYYKIMGLSEDADPQQIKQAYRKLARKYHPDVSKESDAEEKFKELGEAHEVLKDTEKRAAYDQVRHSGGIKGKPIHHRPNGSNSRRIMTIFHLIRSLATFSAVFLVMRIRNNILVKPACAVRICSMP